jgi:hypothetical protein
LTVGGTIVAVTTEPRIFRIRGAAVKRLDLPPAIPAVTPTMLVMSTNINAIATVVVRTM